MCVSPLGLVGGGMGVDAAANETRTDHQPLALLLTGASPQQRCGILLDASTRPSLHASTPPRLHAAGHQSVYLDSKRHVL